MREPLQMQLVQNRLPILPVSLVSYQENVKNKLSREIRVVLDNIGSVDNREVSNNLTNQRLEHLLSKKMSISSLPHREPKSNLLGHFNTY